MKVESVGTVNSKRYPQPPYLGTRHRGPAATTLRYPEAYALMLSRSFRHALRTPFGCDGARGCEAESSSLLSSLPPDARRKVWVMMDIPELCAKRREFEQYMKEIAEWSTTERSLMALELREYNEEIAECITKKRADAEALVTAPEGTPGSKLTRPQQVFRCLQRVCRRKDPFTGAPVEPLPSPFLEDTALPRDVDQHIGDDHFNAGYERAWGGTRWGGTFSVRHANGACLPKKAVCAVLLCEPDATQPGGFRCDDLRIDLHPHSPDDCVWMQGLLLALTGGEQGLLWDGRPSDMPGVLAHCTRFTVRWDAGCAACPASAKELWPLKLPWGPPRVSQNVQEGNWDQNFDEEQEVPPPEEEEEEESSGAGGL